MKVKIHQNADIEQRFDVVASTTGRTKAPCNRQALEEHLDAYLAQAELDAVRTGRSETVSLETLLKRHDAA